MYLRRIAVWALPMTIGAVLIALPDTGPRLFSFSSEHGPSLTDFTGIVLLLIGYVAMSAPIIRQQRSVRHALVRRPRLTMAVSFAAGLGTGLLLASVLVDFWWWWLVGSVVLLAFWLYLWRLAVRHESPPLRRHR